MKRMKTDQIIMCVVALLLGMLLANMLKNVCGCKNVVEGQGNPNCWVEGTDYNYARCCNDNNNNNSQGCFPSGSGFNHDMCCLGAPPCEGVADVYSYTPGGGCELCIRDGLTPQIGDSASAWDSTHSTGATDAASEAFVNCGGADPGGGPPLIGGSSH